MRLDEVPRHQVHVSAFPRSMSACSQKRRPLREATAVAADRAPRRGLPAPGPDWCHGRSVRGSRTDGPARPGGSTPPGGPARPCPRRWRSPPRRRTGSRPSRMVLLRGLDHSGLVFFTDRESEKGRELAVESVRGRPLPLVPSGAPSGPASRVRWSEVEDAESDAYWRVAAARIPPERRRQPPERGDREQSGARRAGGPAGETLLGRRPAPASPVGWLPDTARRRGVVGGGSGPPPRPAPLSTARRRLDDGAVISLRAARCAALTRRGPRGPLRSDPHRLVVSRRG